MLKEPSSKKELSLIYSLFRSEMDENLPREQKKALRSDANSKLLSEFGHSVDRYHASVKFSQDSAKVLHESVSGEKVFLDHGSAEHEFCKLIEDALSSQDFSDKERSNLVVEPSVNVFAGDVIVLIDFPEIDSMSERVVDALTLVDQRISDLTGGESGITIQTNGLDNKISTFSNQCKNNDNNFTSRRSMIEFSDPALSNEATRKFIFTPSTATEANATVFVEKHRSSFENIYQNYLGKLDRTAKTHEQNYVM